MREILEPTGGAEPAAVAAFFGSAEMRACMGADAQLQAWLDVEAALARAQASLGLIPKSAAAAITNAARVEGLDLAVLSAETKRTGHPVVPLVRALAEAAGPRAGKHVHRGATTQDIMDTGYVLLARQGLPIVERQLRELAATLRRLARRYRDTPVAGRTHGQHAVPTTFGLRAAGWFEEVQRHRARIEDLRPRLLTGSFGGAAGTLAGYGAQAIRLRKAVMKELGLGAPVTSWHAAPDRFAECISVFGLIAATAEKIAGEVYLLGRTEIAEAFEPQAKAQMGSSTMPQKQNPIRSEAVISAAQLLRAKVPAAMGAMVAQDDRDMGSGMLLWKLVPEAFVLLGGILERLIEVVGGWRIDPKAMARNLERTGGAIMAEAVMLRLAEKMDRARAHALVHAAARRAGEADMSFLDCLCADAEIARHLSPGELEDLTDPKTYLGAAGEIVDLAVGRARRRTRNRRTPAGGR